MPTLEAGLDQPLSLPQVPREQGQGLGLVLFVKGQQGGALGKTQQGGESQRVRLGTTLHTFGADHPAWWAVPWAQQHPWPPPTRCQYQRPPQV